MFQNQARILHVNQILAKILERSCIKPWQDLGKIFDRDIEVSLFQSAAGLTVSMYMAVCVHNHSRYILWW